MQGHIRHLRDDEGVQSSVLGFLSRVRRDPEAGPGLRATAVVERLPAEQRGDVASQERQPAPRTGIRDLMLQRLHAVEVTRQLLVDRVGTEPPVDAPVVVGERLEVAQEGIVDGAGVHVQRRRARPISGHDRWDLRLLVEAERPVWQVEHESQQPAVVDVRGPVAVLPPADRADHRLVGWQLVAVGLGDAAQLVDELRLRPSAIHPFTTQLLIGSSTRLP
jgi:hypothetical protein